MITSVSPFWGPSSTLIGVERAARDAGFYLSVAGLPSIEPAGVNEVLGHFLDQGVEGIVVIAPEAAMAHMAEPFVTDIPVVMVAAGARTRSRRSDHRRRPGTRRPAGDPPPDRARPHQHRSHRRPRPVVRRHRPAAAAGARELADAGLRAGPLAAGDWTAASGYRIGAQWLQRKRLPSAVFVANDLMALGFIRAMHDAGVTVPGEVSIVGFDDMPGADHFIPGLTTIRQDLDTLGRQCIEMLIAALNQTPSDTPLVEPVLVVRDSATASR